MEGNKEVRLVGWLSRDKSRNYLATASGNYLLDGVDQAAGGRGSRPVSGPALVLGEMTDSTTVAVKELRTTEAGTPERMPYFAQHPMPQLAVGSMLRGKLHEWLRQNGFIELTLPTVWGQSEEYGVEEFTVSHSRGSTGGNLKLLQSSEFPLYTALAEGIDRCFTFGRCYRLEQDAEPERSGDYIMEFEQLVIASSFTDLPEMAGIARQLVNDLAEAVGVRLTDDDFCYVGPVGLDVASRQSELVMDDLLFFTVPPHWPIQARQVLLSRITELGATVHRLDSAEDVLGQPGGAVRWAIEPLEASASSLRRVLDIADSMTVPPSRDINQVLIRQWNPTWNVYPPLHWRSGERRDSALPVRSITSRRERAADGSQCIADAELYLAGREVVHVRAYADHAQFAENLELAELTSTAARYEYLLGSLEAAPPGMVGIFIGWERLLSVLAGASYAADALLFPRAGNGRLIRPCGPPAVQV